MLTIVPVSYQEFKTRQIVNGSCEMLEAELDKVKHRSYPDWDNADSDPDALVEQLDDGNSDYDPISDEDEENLGLITGVAEPRRYFYPGAEASSDDPFSDNNLMNFDGHEENCDLDSNNPDEHGSKYDEAGDALSVSGQASVRFPSMSPPRRLSMDSERSSLSYTDFYIMNSRGSVFAAPVRSRWSTDARPYIPIEDTNHTILSKRIIEDEKNVEPNHYNLVQFAPSVMSLHLIMATTGTLAPFTRGYASQKAEHEDFRIFCADAQRKEEETEMLELLQQRSMRRRDYNQKQRKRDVVKSVIMKPVKKVRQRFSSHHARQKIDEEGTQALLSPVAEEWADREALDDL